HVTICPDRIAGCWGFLQAVRQRAFGSACDMPLPMRVAFAWRGLPHEVIHKNVPDRAPDIGGFRPRCRRVVEDKIPDLRLESETDRDRVDPPGGGFRIFRCGGLVDREFLFGRLGRRVVSPDVAGRRAARRSWW